MGKTTVSLRQRFRPRLLLETFEDRALLSAGRGLSALFPTWLTSNHVAHFLDSRAVAVVSSESRNAASPVEGEKVQEEKRAVERQSTSDARKVEHENKHSRNHSNSDKGSGRNEERVHSTDEGETFLKRHDKGASADSRGDFGQTREESNAGTGEDLAPDQGTKKAPVHKAKEETADSSGANSGRNFDDEANAGRKERLLTALREKFQAGDGTVSQPPVVDGPVPDSSVVRALKHYASEQGDAGTEAGADRGGVLPSAESNHSGSGGERSPLHESRDSGTGNGVVAPPASVSSQEADAGEAGPYRAPSASRSDGAHSPGRVETDVGLAGRASQAPVLPRAETPGPDTRGQDRVVPVQALARQAADVSTNARAPEAAEVRLTPSLPTTAAEYAAVANRAETTARATASGTSPQAPLYVASGRIEAAEAATTEATGPQLAAAGVSLGVWDVAVFAPHLSGLIDGMVPFDRAAVQAAVQQLLTQVEDLGSDAAEWLARMNLSPWVVAVAVGLTACDVVRRRQQQAQRGLVLTDEDGTPLTWFPGLAGLWTMQDA